MAVVAAAHLACMPDMASLAVELPTRSLVRLALRHPGSNCALERSCWECLDDCLGRLCFDHYFFAKHHLLGGFCRWFPPSLDPGKAGDGEHACLLDFSGANLCQATQELSDDALSARNWLQENRQWHPWSWPFPC